MTKDQVCTILEEIALLLELKGENVFKFRAYQNAVRALELFTGDFSTLAQEGHLPKIDGIGKAIAEKITELVQTGKLPYHEELKAEFPPEIFDLFEIQGLGAKKIKALNDQLGVSSIPLLEKACREKMVETLPGFGEKTQEKLLAAIELHHAHAKLARRGKVAPIAEAILEMMRTHPDVTRLSLAGSYRRAKEVLGDLDLVVSSKYPESVMNGFASLPEIDSILLRGPTKMSVRLKSGIQCDLRVVSDAEYPFALNYFTGSKEHNVELRNRALTLGWTLNEYRLASVDETKSPPCIRDETELYQALDLAYIPPELRENTGELEAAAQNRLPKLIEWSNLRGTFHNHTTASDGKNTLQEMVDAADELGLDYLGIADHSKSSVQANGLSEERLLNQLAEIRALQQAGSPVRIFTGVECDILKDGSLDFADDLLSQLDYVVASVHSSFTLSEEEMTARIIRAMENRYVTMLGHLTGRILLTREPYAVNIPKLIDCAAATGTWIELNANPYRLDMDWRWWHLAKDKGVKCVINPDAHQTKGLLDLFYGVGIARKGWLTRNDVMNCLPLSEIETALRRKRQLA